MKRRSEAMFFGSAMIVVASMALLVGRFMESQNAPPVEYPAMSSTLREDKLISRMTEAQMLHELQKTVVRLDKSGGNADTIREINIVMDQIIRNNCIWCFETNGVLIDGSLGMNRSLSDVVEEVHTFRQTHPVMYSDPIDKKIMLWIFRDHSLGNLLCTNRLADLLASTNVDSEHVSGGYGPKTGS